MVFLKICFPPITIMSLSKIGTFGTDSMVGEFSTIYGTSGLLFIFGEDISEA